MVREAFALLRQSIIHVEKDDIDIDDEEDEEELAAAAQTNGHDGMDEDGNAGPPPSSLAAGPATTPTRGPAREATATPRQPTPGPSGTTGAAAQVDQQGQANGTHAGTPVATGAQPKKTKVTISYDKYQMIKSLVVLRLSEMERETGEGVSRPEIVTWYLEQRENEIQTVEELENERMLVEKVITKLIKVG